VAGAAVPGGTEFRPAQQSETANPQEYRSKEAPMHRYGKLMLGLVVLCWGVVPSLAGEPGGGGACSQSEITWVVESLERMIFRPEQVLADVDAFWKEDATHKRVASWHKYTDIPIPLAEWKEGLAALSELTEPERRNHPALVMARTLMDQTTTFREKAIPHMCSFLPRNNLDINTNVYFTAFTYPRAFSIRNETVIDVINPYYEGDPSNIMNTLVHEVFHTGYNNNRYLQSEVWLDSFQLNDLLMFLHNEGMATYVGYTAQDFFPSTCEADYEMLDNPKTVRKLRGKINKLLENAQSTAAEKLKKQAWKVGVDERGYYIVGGHMARTIDERLGRAALAETVAKGPTDFIHVYNGLVEENMQIYELSGPATLSKYQLLRQAALDRDYERYAEIMGRIREDEESMDDYAMHALIFAGRILLAQEEWTLAVETCELNAQRSPELSFLQNFLGDAYAKAGNRDAALACYKRVLELDPNDLYASAKIAKLVGE
jgi:hypothetical protein